MNFRNDNGATPAQATFSEGIPGRKPITTAIAGDHSEPTSLLGDQFANKQFLGLDEDGLYFCVCVVCDYVQIGRL
jgi:hypothetical protein